MGRKFFSKEWKNYIDIQLGDRRFVSIDNVLTVTDWPIEWTGNALFELVGYSSKGYKMSLLTKTYVPDQPWYDFLNALRDPEKNGKGFSAWGMNFNCRREGKGGCLSAIHLVRHGKRNILFVHGKIAEVPRKFVADLLLIRDMLQGINMWPMEVRFMYSTVYYSIVGLRAMVPVLGVKNVSLHGLPILTPRNYQAGIIEAIEQTQVRLGKKYGGDPWEKYIHKKEGEWR